MRNPPSPARFRALASPAPYLTVFTSARLFELIPIVPAFAFMILFCTLGCALALMQNSQSMALAAFAVASLCRSCWAEKARCPSCRSAITRC